MLMVKEAIHMNLIKDYIRNSQMGGTGFLYEDFQT